MGKIIYLNRMMNTQQITLQITHDSIDCLEQLVFAGLALILTGLCVISSNLSVQTPTSYLSTSYMALIGLLV